MCIRDSNWWVGMLGAAMLVVAGVWLPGASGAEDTLAAIERIWEPDGSRSAPAVTLTRRRAAESEHAR